jgi:tetratricopeptide (TPR) repeat protein
MDNAELRARAAAALDAAGCVAEARQAYIAALAATPSHPGALHGLAALLTRTGARRAAQTVYRQITLCHPGDAAGQAGYANTLFEAGDLTGARLGYETALAARPGYPEAHQGLGNICAALGDHAGARAHWTMGYRDRVFNVWAYRGKAAPIRVLLLISVAGGNVRVLPFLDDTIFAVTAVAAEFLTDAHDLPPHDLVLNAIGDADLCGTALDAACRLCARTTRAVVNDPAHVRRTGRADNAARLGRIAGVVTPLMATLPRAALVGGDGEAALAALGLGFPVLLRAPGFHTGRHFVCADDPAGLAQAAALPGEQTLAIEYLDSRGPDGHARKGRVLRIGGAMYPLHWAVSPEWKVHYCTAPMAENAAHRAEEARFLKDWSGFLGAGAAAALRRAGAALGLEYCGIDFSVAADGRVQLFEANATMVILMPPEGRIWRHRRQAAARALAAARAMLLDAARGNRGRGTTLAGDECPRARSRPATGSGG